jgi:molybdopterin converting factor small subunit
MKIKIICSGAIGVEGVDEDGYLEVGKLATVASILRRVKADWKLKIFIPILVNGEKAGKLQRLKDGDQVTLFVPMAGG